MDLLVDNELNEQSGQLRSALRQANVSEQLIESVGLQEIASKHFPLESKNKKSRELANRFRHLVCLIGKFKELITSGESGDVLNWFQKNRQKNIEGVIRRLSKHSVSGHYFFETLTIDEEEDSNGYVCLLREVASIPRAIAEEIGSGLSKAWHDDICSREHYISDLSIEPDDLAMPIIEIASPTIEHVMQSFATLFGRIGVSDPVEDVIGKILVQCLSNWQDNTL